jgi:hypothetical protein
MKDYQRKKNNPYFLPKTLYRRVMSVIRDYDRQIEEIDNIIFGTSHSDVVVSGGIAGKPTEEMVIRLSKYERDTSAVERALDKIPQEYRQGVFDNIRYGKRFPEGAAYRTWLRWKQKFIYLTAINLELV